MSQFAAQENAAGLANALQASAVRQADTARDTGQRLARDLAKRGAEMSEASAALSGAVQRVGPFDCVAYAQDFVQRSILMMDVLRARGDQYLEYEQGGQPSLLAFDYEVIADGKHLPRPVNYFIVQIKPSVEVKIRPDAQPFVIVDPRAGQGAGVGGLKATSEVGVALQAGHPVYFLMFTQMPVDGQTLEDVGAAEAHFLEIVKARHPHSPSPCVVGNCQGGWAVMALAAAHPELMGLVVINGAPLSYWAGAEGQNPMRYVGGLLGGSWAAHFTADLGNGKFDGAHLVSNFERLDPANTYWSKYAKLFANIDTEAPRFLQFERWWSDYIFLTRPEIETIVDDLFIGNELTGSGADTGPRRLDLRRITAPVVVFCSDGDNITPPQQALDWIVDLYPDDAELAASGQTIVYLRHASAGHLGIFASSAVAGTQHKEIFNAAEAIMTLPPGLYEMELEPAQGAEAPSSGSSTKAGDACGSKVAFYRRGIDDIRNLNPDSRHTEAEFAAVRKISDLNLKAYETLMQPWVRTLVGESLATLIRQCHPLRLGHHYWSSRNPALQHISQLADQVRAHRAELPAQHPMRQVEATFSQAIAGMFDTYRDLRDAATATLFHAWYAPASAVFQQTQADAKPSAAPSARSTTEREAELVRAERQGGYREAVVRLFLLAGRLRGRIEKATLEHLHAACDRLSEFAEIAPATRRHIVREQAELIARDPLLARNTLLDLLPHAAQRTQALNTVADIYLQLGLADDPRLKQAWDELCRELGQPDDLPNTEGAATHESVAVKEADAAQAKSGHKKHQNLKVAGRL
jgi:pimeloyl-ACP methyl ester carboxylesterase